MRWVSTRFLHHRHPLCSLPTLTLFNLIHMTPPEYTAQLPPPPHRYSPPCSPLCLPGRSPFFSLPPIQPLCRRFSQEELAGRERKVGLCAVLGGGEWRRRGEGEEGRRRRKRRRCVEGRKRVEGYEWKGGLCRGNFKSLIRASTHPSVPAAGMNCSPGASWCLGF